MKRHKKSRRKSSKPPLTVQAPHSTLNVYNVQYQVIRNHRVPVKDPDNPKAAPHEIHTTEERFDHVLAEDKTAASDYIKSLAVKDHDINIVLVSEVGHNVVGRSLSKAHPMSASKRQKHSTKKEKRHGSNRNSLSRGRSKPKSKARIRRAKARKSKAQKAESRKAKEIKVKVEKANS